MDKTLVYAPEVKVEVISNGVLHDISNDVIGGQVSRVTNSVSSASINLANRGLKYNGLFKRMDRIQISLKRITWIQVFTGYLDSVPVLQLYPGTVTLRASCTLKRLLHTWWDSNLPASQELLDQRRADDMQDEANGITDEDRAKIQEEAPANNSDNDSVNADAGLGMMLKNILVKVGGWEEEDVHIQDVPESFLAYLSDNLEGYENSETLDKFKDLFGWNETIGTTGGGGGGGDLGEATFTSIGPPANGSNYSMDELVAIVAGAGWKGDDIAIGASIIQAESSGNPGAVNDKNANGTIDRGLWQINSIHEHRLHPGESWFDPAVSTRMAREIYSEAGGWSPWSTFSYFGSNASHLADARAAVARGIGPVPGNSGSKSKPTGGIGKVGNVTSASSIDSNKGDNKDKNKEKDKSRGNTAETPTPAPGPYEYGSDWLARVGLEANGPIMPNTSEMSVYESISAVALYKFPMMCRSAGKDDHDADGGNHPAGLAADISNGTSNTPEMMDLAQWWYDNFMGKGLKELIHAPFMHNVKEDEDKGDGYAYYTSGTMEGHRNHVHIAMSGVVSADGTSTGTAGSGGGGGGGISFENKLGKSLFNYIFDPMANDTGAISDMFDGERAPINDEPLIKTVKSISDASMRTFQSGPDGSFMAFYPDYFGTDGQEAILYLEDIELKEFHIDANDDAFTTHVFVKGNLAFSGLGGSTEYGWLQSSGIATIESEWLFKRLVNASVVEPEFNSKEEAYARYGLRPYKEEMSNVGTPEMEFLSACSIFMQKWAQQYSTKVEFTFMPELYPGMRIELVGHNVTVYVQSVVHNFSFSGGGFTTTATICAPSSSATSSQRVDGSQKSTMFQYWSSRGSTSRAGSSRKDLS